MFKKSKWKIVAAVFFILTLVLAGTFAVIYWASYNEMSRENRQLLEQYINGYTLHDEKPASVPPEQRPGTPQKAPPRLELSTFYSVSVSKTGQILRVDTADIASVDETSLVQIANDILNSKKHEGIRHDLMYLVADKGDYRVVAFLDNTVLRENTGTLLNYTLIFGCVALLPLFLLSWFLAGRIVSPLEESYRLQKQFISDAGHELKTPIAVVNANLELLFREIGKNPWLSNIEYENERMSGLVTQLLDLAKTEHVKPSMELLDFSRLVLGEALPFETVAFENGLRLETDVTAGISLYGNSIQLKQLVSILIDNGIRHSRDKQPVSVHLQKVRNNAVFSVRNAGKEIPPEERQHIFERFYRIDEARTDDHHYGLGLAIARAVAASHHGTIQVQCKDGMTEFLVKLPLQYHLRKK